MKAEAPRSALFHPLPYRVALLFMGSMFVYAAAVKLAGPAAFSRALSHYGILPEPLLPLAALGIPALELVAGAGVLMNRRGALGLMAGMLAGFMVALYYGVLAGLEIDCGCYMPWERAGHASLRQALWRDAVFLGVIAYLYAARALGADKDKIRPKKPIIKEET